jgi:hypothetical protein
MQNLESKGVAVSTTGKILRLKELRPKSREHGSYGPIMPRLPFRSGNGAELCRYSVVKYREPTLSLR